MNSQTHGEIERFIRACRDSALRVTPQRIAIYREVSRTEEHPDAETVCSRVREDMPTVSLDTVYRTLTTLEEHGLISRVEMPSGPTRFDANTDKHHHFVCSECGRIHDFYSGVLDEFAPPPEVARLGTVDSVHVQLRGVCAHCEARRQQRTADDASPEA